MRRREAGRVRRPRAIFAGSHPGGAGAPPGSTTRPCQELADIWMGAIGLWPIERGVQSGKRGPAPNEHRDWRAERRPPLPSGSGTIGLRLSARHPRKPGRIARRAAIGAIWLVAAIAGAFSGLVETYGPPPLGRDLEVSRVVLDRNGTLLRAYLTSEGRWRLAATRNDVNWIGAFTGAFAATPSDASASEMLPGDLETARQFGKRVAEVATKWAK